MKIFFAFVFSLLLWPALPAARAQSVFPDVPDNHWAAAAVGKLAAAGIIEGFPAAPSTPSASSDTTKKVVLYPSRIAPAIRLALSKSSALESSRIDIDSTDKGVMLSGTVNTAAQKKLAGRIAADNAEGYKIINNLKIVQPKTKAR